MRLKEGEYYFKFLTIPEKTLSHLRAINYIVLHSLFGELITFTFFGKICITQEILCF